MRVVVDMQGVQAQFCARGLRSSSMAFCLALARNRGRHELLLCLNGLLPHTIEPIRAAFEGLLPQGALSVWYAPGPLRAGAVANTVRRTIAARLCGAFMAALRPDVIAWTGCLEGFDCDVVTAAESFPAGVPTVAVLDDGLPLAARSVLLAPYSDYERFVLGQRQTVRRARLCLALSQPLVGQAQENFGFAAGTVVDLSEGEAALAWCAFERLGETAPPTGKGREAIALDDLAEGLAALLPADAAETDIVALADAAGRIALEERPRRLLVDVSELVRHDAGSGVQRVAKNILRQLLEHPPQGVEVGAVYATTLSPGYLHADFLEERLSGGSGGRPETPVDWRAGDVFLGLDLQRSSTLAQSERLKAMRRDGVGVFFVVYDLLPLQFPHYWPAKHCVPEIHRQWLEAISEFDGVLCISRTVASEMADWLRRHPPRRLRPLRLGWFHLGADLDGAASSQGMPADAAEVLATLKGRPSFLCVGTIEPRKGQSQALEAFELLWQEGEEVNLVLAGRAGWLVDDLMARLSSHRELGRRLFWLDGISDEYLAAVYASSACLLAPSEGEGFGLPLIEGAQHGLPILARDIPVFREVAGEHAAYFRGLEPGALAQAVRRWLALWHQGAAPESLGLPWLTWRQSAEALVQVLGGMCGFVGAGVGKPRSPGRALAEDIITDAGWGIDFGSCEVPDK